MSTSLHHLTTMTIPDLNEQIHTLKNEKDDLKCEMQRMEARMQERVYGVERDFQEIVDAKEDRLRQMESKVKNYKKKVEEQKSKMAAEENRKELEWQEQFLK